MKKIFFILFMLYSCVINSQEIQIQTNKNLHKFVTEYMSFYDKNTFYVYGELSISRDISTYIQTFHEYNLGFVNTHAEYRSMFTRGGEWSNVFIIGVSVPVFSRERYYLNLAPLYRYENANQWQATATYGFSFSRITFDGYFDFYGDKSLYAFSENKLKCHFNKFFVGTNIEYYLESSYSKVTPYVMVGIKF